MEFITILNYLSYKKIQKIKNKTLVTICFILPLLGTSLFSTNTFADYMPSERGGYLPYYISINTAMTVSSYPVYGTNGQKYYRVGNQMVLGGASGSDPNVTNGNGYIACYSQFQSWSPGGINLSNNAIRWKKGVITSQPLGFSIDGVAAYQLSRDVTMTIHASDPEWTKSNVAKIAAACYPPATNPNQDLNFHTLDTYFFVNFILENKRSIISLFYGGT